MDGLADRAGVVTVRRLYRRFRHAERAARRAERDTRRLLTWWALAGGGAGSGAAAVAHDQVAHALSFVAQHVPTITGSLGS